MTGPAMVNILAPVPKTRPSVLNSMAALTTALAKPQRFEATARLGKGSDKGVNVQRYKGLGEMSDQQLWDTTMDPAKRRLRKITIDNAAEAERTFSYRIETIVAAIRRHYPDCAITLSLGEKSREAYERFFHAGANRYLLRHETYDATHYSQLHPAGMSGKQRLQCLQNLKETGYQTGTGIMVGSPGQTVEHLIQDILFIEKLRPEMIGIGPFLPHQDTPFARYSSGTLEQTLLLLSIFRLMHPSALIPSTTALAIRGA